MYYSNNRKVGEKMSSERELILVQQARSGDTAAEETLVRQYTRFAENCARAFYLQGGDSDDLTQEGMLGLMSAIRSYEPHRGASFKTFALLCIRRRIYSALRKYSNRAEGTDEPETANDIPAPEDEYITREHNRELLDGLASNMSGLEKQILSLYLDGLSYGEIADRIGKSAKSVDNAIQRIRRKSARLHE